MMRRSFPSVMLCVALAASCTPLAAQQPAQPPPAQAAPPKTDTPQQRDQSTGVRRVVVELVDVLFSVLNRRQRFITDLQKENFSVFEDSQQQQITFFSRETDLPLRVGMLLDTSNSIRDRMKFEQEAAIDFLYNVIRRKKDMAFLMTFDNEPSVILDYTEDLGTLRDVILRQRAGGGTALYDAIYNACRNQLSSPPRPSGDNQLVRRVLVVISDGDDNLSSHSRSEAIEMAQRAGVVIYAISTSTQWVTANEERDPTKQTSRKYHKDAGDKVLDDITEETGGRSFFPYRVDDLAQSFLDIGDELRSQYSLAYVPTNKIQDGRFRRIRIEVDRKGLQVRARKGYYPSRAAAETSKPAAKAPGY